VIAELGRAGPPVTITTSPTRLNPKNVSASLALR